MIALDRYQLILSPTVQTQGKNQLELLLVERAINDMDTACNLDSE